ncbi:MAG: hypothetical protein KIT00_06130 [Rhodospirillales bacterium]|nr:hypothetical protein [Rhodospirillales bacterium]
MALLAAVALMSAGALAFEVLLVRMVSIAQWHHFAHMIISVALLGFGASGTALTFLRERLLNRLPVSFAVLATLFGLTAPAGFALSQAVPLNVPELAWDHRQQFNLLLVYLLLAVPYRAAGVLHGHAVSHRPR